MSAEGGTPVTVPMVGKIISIEVKVGDQVNENDKLIVIEAMKMKIPVVAPVTGTVRSIQVQVGQTVESETVIAIIQ